MTEGRKRFYEALRWYAHTSGKTTAAADIAGMSVPNFCKKLREFGLKAAEFRARAKP